MKELSADDILFITQTMCGSTVKKNALRTISDRYNDYNFNNPEAIQTWFKNIKPLSKFINLFDYLINKQSVDLSEYAQLLLNACLTDTTISLTLFKGTAQYLQDQPTQLSERAMQEVKTLQESLKLRLDFVGPTIALSYNRALQCLDELCQNNKTKGRSERLLTLYTAFVHEDTTNKDTTLAASALIELNSPRAAAAARTNNEMPFKKRKI